MTTRVLALDVGDRRIGVALSDPLGITAQPLEVIERRGWRHDLEHVRRLVETYGAVRVVVGMPRRLDGTAGPQAEKVGVFIGRLREALPVPVEAWDERLTTVAASRAMIEGGVRREQRRRRIDAVAAALLLDTYLRALRAHAIDNPPRE